MKRNKSRLKHWLASVRELFHLSASDRKIFTVFTLVIASGTGLFFVMESGEQHAVRTLDDTGRAHFRKVYQTAMKQADSTRYSRKRKTTLGYATAESVPATFRFDPNTADSTSLLALGFAPWQVRAIYKYRAKGGRFHRSRDIARIYGMTGEQLEHLLPLVDIAPKYRYLSDTLPEKPEAPDSTRTEKIQKFKEPVLVDLNTADTLLLRRIPGIGRGFALWIVRYRERLGGYVSVRQLKEIPHFPDSLLPYFHLPGTAPLRQLQVNDAPLSALRRHPYLNYYQCRIIMEHRRKYGRLKRIDELSFYEEFTPEDLERLHPYLKF